MLNALTLIRCILVGIVIPFLAGKSFLFLIQGRKNDKAMNMGLFLISGYLLIWTMIELLAIPVTMLKASFSCVFIPVTVVVILAAIAGLVIIIKDIRGNKGDEKYALISVFKTKSDVIAFVIFILLAIGLICVIEMTLFYDADDSRFLVNAGDILRTNRILSTDPVTGGPINEGYRDFKKDLIGQWSAFLAYGAKLSGLNATVYAHSVYPVIAMILILLIYWILLGERSITDKSIGLIAVLAFIIFGNYSTHSQETVSVIRIWQGKATMALFGTLTMIYLFGRITERKSDTKNNTKSNTKGEDLRDFILIFTVNMAMSLMSSMGMVLAAVMIAIYGLYAGIIRRNIRVFIISCILCVPNALLYLLSAVYTLDKYLG